MLPLKDITRIAGETLQEHGDAAEAVAARRALELRTNKDVEGAMVWERIAGAVGAARDRRSENIAKFVEAGRYAALLGLGFILTNTSLSPLVAYARGLFH